MRFLNRYFFAGVGTGCVLSVLLAVGGTFAFGYWAMKRMQGLTEAGGGGSVLAAPETPPPDRALSAYGEAEWDWALQSLDGETVTLGDLRGQPIFLNFWATWCGPCKLELPNLQRLYDSLATEGITFVMASKEDPETVQGFLENEPYDMPFYIWAGSLPRDLDARAVPTTYVIDPTGIIVLKEVGAKAWDAESTIAFLRRLAREEG